MKLKLNYLKKDAVLTAALGLAIVSAVFIPPSAKYIEYIDFRVLGILLSLMLVMEGYKSQGVFDRIGSALIAHCRSGRQLEIVLVFLCFFSSMLLTNDVALITFVPFSLLTLRLAGMEDLTCIVIVLQTIAANLGSMLTPMGNPQNLYLFNASGMSIGAFVKLTAPYVGIAGILLLVFLFFVRSSKEGDLSANIAGTKNSSNPSVSEVPERKMVIIYSALFILAICCVLHLIPWYVVLIVIAAVIAVVDRHLLKQADYALLLTFVGFFVFIGNMGRIPAVNEVLVKLVSGHELAASIISSQLISNVPAALLLSGFTNDYSALIIGTNLGGLGTLIASMASLISYKQLANAYPERKKQYFVEFTVCNIVFLLLLVLAGGILR